MSRLREASRRRSAAASPTADSTPLAGRHSTRRAPSWAASSHACSGPGAAERDQRGARGVVAALDRHDAQRLNHRVHRDGDDALGGLLGRAHAEALERGARGVEVEPQVGGDRRRGRQAAEHEVGVGDRGLLAAAAVAGRAGVGARALRPDAQRPAAVDPRDRAAAGADRVDVDHRQAHRQAGDGALHGEVGLAAALGEEERVAARAAHVEAQRGRLADDPRRHRAAGRAGEQHRGRVGGGLLERRDPAGGEHHVRLRQPGRLAWPRAAGRGSGRWAGRARRRRSRSSRARTRAPRRPPRARRRRTRPAARRAGSRPRAPRAPGRGTRTAGTRRRPPRGRARAASRRARTLASSSAPDHVVRPHPLVDLHAQPALDHRRRRRLVQPVEARARLAAEEEQVAEALGGDERRARQARARAARWWRPWSRARSASTSPGATPARSSTSRAAATTPSSWRAVLRTLAVTMPSGPTSTASVNVPPTSTPSALMRAPPAPPRPRAGPRSWCRGPRDRPGWCWPARGPGTASAAAGCARGSRR